MVTRLVKVPPSEPLASQEGRARLKPLAKVATLAAGFAGLLSLLYATSIYADAADSDKATTILVGQAIGDGHVLLHGWILPPGNYWATDAAFYALATRLSGLRPGLLYAEPAIVAAVTISVGVLIATNGRRGAAAIAGAVAVVALLGFATPAMAYWFVGKGFHVATGLYALVALGLLRVGGFGWRWVLAVALLALGMLGDFMIVAFAMAPLFVAGAAAMLRQRRWQSGIAQLTAAVAAAGIGELVLRLAHVLGAFMAGAPVPIAGVSQMLTNLRDIFTYGAYLVGLANGRFGTAGVPLALLSVHVVGALCMVACFVAATASLAVGVIRGHPRRQRALADTELWRLDDMLVIATIGSAVPFVLLAGPNGIGIHYLVVPVVFASVLTGRMVARLWPRLKAAGAVRALAIGGVAVSLSLGSGLGYELSQPEPAPSAGHLAAWLEAHDLRNGIGGYWSSAITTVESHGAVTVRPVSIGRNGELQRLMFQSTASWYAGQRFQFFVYGSTPRPFAMYAARTFGRPAHTYIVGPYHVLVWGHSLSVAPFPPADVLPQRGAHDSRSGLPPLPDATRS